MDHVTVGMACKAAPSVQGTDAKPPSCDHPKIALRCAGDRAATSVSGLLTFLMCCRFPERSPVSSQGGNPKSSALQQGLPEEGYANWADCACS